MGVPGPALVPHAAQSSRGPSWFLGGYVQRDKCAPFSSCTSAKSRLPCRVPGRSLPSGEVGAPSVFRNQWERVGVGRRKGTRADRREKEHTSGRDGASEGSEAPLSVNVRPLCIPQHRGFPYCYGNMEGTCVTSEMCRQGPHIKYISIWQMLRAGR